MSRISVLDCTLRDGGYVNNWEFGENNIKKIICKLSESNIDIIECGFLTQKKERDKSQSLYDSAETAAQYLTEPKNKEIYVCMINYGEYNIDDLENRSDGSIDGIRVAFHKKDLIPALEFCKKVAEKGYILFMQPMITVSYTDKEFLALINEANIIEPYAFYIVDSFGVMKRADLMRFFYLVDNNLNKSVMIGYHSHNNIQMAFSNAQALVDLNSRRRIIIDASVFGMGRGAGNLNTELFLDYINSSDNSRYKIKPLLQIIDQFLSRIYQRHYWGYSLPHYISAVYNCHPNYASYLDSKDTLTIGVIEEILSEIPEGKKNSYDRDFIENLYLGQQTKIVKDESSRDLLKEAFRGKTVLLIAPGKSIVKEGTKIKNVILEEDVITISINFLPKDFDCDYTFVSNIRRYKELCSLYKTNLITTSNICNGNNERIIVNYSDLLNNTDAVEDNAAMMLIKLLTELDVKKIRLAGLDGFSSDPYENYANRNMAFIKKRSVLNRMNSGMQILLRKFAERVNIDFVTKPDFIRLEEEE